MNEKDQRNKQSDSTTNPSSGYQSPGSSQTGSKTGSSQQSGTSQGNRDWADDSDGDSSGNQQKRSPGGQPDGGARKAGDRDSSSPRQGGGMSEPESDKADQGGNRPRRDPND
jgi:hypothetical protein